MTTEINIENGSGLTATLVGLQDGTEMELDVVDDRSVTFPDYFTNIALINPRVTGAGGTSANFLVINNNYDAERKREGRRTLLGRFYTLGIP